MHSQLPDLRADTPGTSSVVHFNNAGAGLMPFPVINAIQQHIQLEAETGGYRAAAKIRDEVAQFYTATAKLINAQARNIAYTTNATDAYNRALTSIHFQEGDIILTTNYDYSSNQISFLQLQKRSGVSIVRAQDSKQGEVDLDSIESLIKQHQPKLVAITHVPTSSGLVQPVQAIGELCEKYNSLYMVDACQSAGQLSIDVQSIKCDFLSAAFRKFLRGPRGTGFLYASDRILDGGFEPLFLDTFGATWTEANAYRPLQDAKRFELFERSFALMLGSKAAIEYALQIGTDAIEQRVKYLAKYCREQLPFSDNLQLIDKGSELCGIIALGVKNWEPDTLKNTLYDKGINTAYSPINSARIEYDKKGIEWALRVSPHYYNTEQEIDIFIEHLSELIS